jgi:hypothetical protein
VKSDLHAPACVLIFTVSELYPQFSVWGIRKAEIRGDRRRYHIETEASVAKMSTDRHGARR